MRIAFVEWPEALSTTGAQWGELKDSVGVWFDDANRIAYYYPKDIIDESYKAASYDVVGFTRGEPKGRYLAPANSGGSCSMAALTEPGWRSTKASPMMAPDHSPPLP